MGAELHRQGRGTTSGQADGSGEQRCELVEARFPRVVGGALARVVADRRIGAAVEQQPGELLVAVLRGRVERGRAALAAAVDLGARVEQDLAEATLADEC